MRLYAVILFFGVALAGSKYDCNTKSVLNKERKLIHDLTECGYDVFKPPVENTTSVKVYMHFALKYFNYNSDDQEFLIVLDAYVLWNDTRLKWEPKSYGGLENLEVQGSRIWFPNIKIVNSAQDYLFVDIMNVPCETLYRGNVFCGMKIPVQVKCIADLDNWPFDGHKCQVQFDTDPEQGIRTEIDFGGISLFPGKYGSEWDVIGYTQEKNKTLNSTVQLSLDFWMVRHGKILSCMVIYPCVVVSLLTVSSLFMEGEDVNRLLVASFSLLCHFDVLTDTGAWIPKHSGSSPRVLVFVRGSVALSAAAVVLALCSRRLQGHIRGINLANIVNAVCLLVFIVVYIYLYCAFIPKPLLDEE